MAARYSPAANSIASPTRMPPFPIRYGSRAMIVPASAPSGPAHRRSVPIDVPPDSGAATPQPRRLYNGISTPAPTISSPVDARTSSISTDPATASR